jgi:1,4-alpha-glucan branching enzyme
MHVFEVWAPRAVTIEVKIGDQRFAMASKERGWWSAEVATAGPGTDYGFVIDGIEPALPDPRTQWQPNGVHGESRVVDHEPPSSGATPVGKRPRSQARSSTSCISVPLPPKERCRRPSPTWTT